MATVSTDAKDPGIAARRARLPSLTGLRFVAAVLVLLFHATHDAGMVGGPVGDALAQALDHAGNLGVAFFFVLSGFVLTYSARPGDTARGFWRRRLTKIFPNHLVTFALALVGLVLTGQAVGVGTAVANALLAHTWLPDILACVSVNSVSWSLTCELFFYLAFPWLLRAVNRIPVTRLWMVTAVTALAMTAVPLIAMIAFPDQPKIAYGPLSSVTGPQMWFVYFFPPIRGLDFVLGMMFARLVLSGRWIRLPVLVSALVVLVGYAALLPAPYLVGVSGIASAPAALLIASVAQADVQGTRTGLRSRTWLWLGDISFAFYMVHELVITYGLRLLGADPATLPPVAGIALVLLFLVVALVFAQLLHAGVERPAMRRFATARR